MMRDGDCKLFLNYKTVDQKLYEVTLSKYSEKMKKDNFVVNGKRYYWMSVTEMEKDENIMEKNREVVDFVKEKIV